MSVNEQNVTGRKYRVWDAANNIWKRLSFWTKASDVELNDGTTVETTMGLVKGKFYETTEQAMADLANIPVGSMVYTNDGDSYNVNASNVIYDDGTQQGSNLQIQVEALNSDLVKYYDANGTPGSNGIVSIPAALSSKKILSVEVTGSNGNGLMALNCGDFGARIVTTTGANVINVYTSGGTVKLRWTYKD